MKISDVPWEDLRVGLAVETKSPTDHFRGVIAVIDAPMIWIAWDDGNRQSYNRSVLNFVTLLSQEERVPEFDTCRILSERDIPDAEGE